MSAEILDSPDIQFPEDNYTPNKTQQIVNLVTLNPKVDVQLPAEYSGRKLTKETMESVMKLYNDVSSQYGFDVDWNIEDIQKNFAAIIDDNQEKVFRVLISKAFGKFQLVFYQRAMNTITTLMDQVSSPEVINDRSYSIEWKVGMMTQLFNLMQQVSDMYEKVRVENPDIILKNIAQSVQNEGLDTIQSDPITMGVMEQLRKISLKIGDKKEEDV